MKQRGRKSAASKVAKVVDIKSAKPSPPDGLNDRQCEIWRRVTSTEPPDYFSTEVLRDLLADYCRHRDAADQLSAVISDSDSEWLKTEDGAKRYDKLLRMRDLEAKGVARCATKLRMTNQARYTPKAAATASRNQPAARPWEM